VFIQDAAQSLVVLDEGNIFMANYAAVRGSAMYCDKILGN
jgi:predicted outer membrane repeat protein